MMYCRAHTRHDDDGFIAAGTTATTIATDDYARCNECLATIPRALLLISFAVQRHFVSARAVATPSMPALPECHRSKSPTPVPAFIFKELRQLPTTADCSLIFERDDDFDI